MPTRRADVDQRQSPRPVPESHRFVAQAEAKGSEVMTDEQSKIGRKWIDEAEEALDRTGEALRAAWEGSREARVSALEAARAATNRLTEAIDKGFSVARETWESSRETAAAAEEE